MKFLATPLLLGLLRSENCRLYVWTVRGFRQLQTKIHMVLTQLYSTSYLLMSVAYQYVLLLRWRLSD